MTGPILRFNKPPIIEAVIDFDCSMAPGFSIEELQNELRLAYRDNYPAFRPQFISAQTIHATPEGPPKVEFKHELRAFQFVSADKKQIVQARVEGFSFNRLEPYDSFDSYLPEIERTWLLYKDISKPVDIRTIRLRYINKMLLPMVDKESIDLEQYIFSSPRMPNSSGLSYIGFAQQQHALDHSTGFIAAIQLASQPIQEKNLPIVFDITVSSGIRLQIDDWASISSIVDSLRQLKNRIFDTILTEKCKSLFQPLDA